MKNKTVPFGAINSEIAASKPGSRKSKCLLLVPLKNRRRERLSGVLVFAVKLVHN